MYRYLSVLPRWYNLLTYCSIQVSEVGLMQVHVFSTRDVPECERYNSMGWHIHLTYNILCKQWKNINNIKNIYFCMIKQLKRVKLIN